MNNIKRLEKQWFSYKSKIFLIPIIKIALFYLLIVGGYYFYTLFHKSKESVSSPYGISRVMGVSRDSNLTKGSLPQENHFVNKNFHEQKSTNLEKIATVKEEALSPISKPISKPIVPTAVEIQKVEEEKHVREELSLEPIIPLINMKEERRKVVSHRRRHKKKHGTKHLVKAKASRALTSKELTTMTHPVTVKRQRKKMNFRGSSVNYIEKMKEKFAQSKQGRDALLLAKAYYSKQNYKESEEWALRANRLDKNSDESWFIFAKSKAKLGKRDEAIKILTHYYAQTHSPKVKQVLRKLKRNKI